MISTLTIPSPLNQENTFWPQERSQCVVSFPHFILNLKFTLKFPLPGHHYRFTVELAKPKNAETWVQGSLTAGIFSDKGNLRNIDLTPKGTQRLEHGTTYQVVITNPHDLGERITKV